LRIMLSALLLSFHAPSMITSHAGNAGVPFVARAAEARFVDAAMIVGPGGVSQSVPTVNGAPRVAQLLDGSMRNAAACALLRRQLYTQDHRTYDELPPKDGCKVRNVMRGHPTDPQALFLVWLASEADDPAERLAPTAGHIILFDGAGRIVPFFAAANYLQPTDAVFDYRKDRARAIALVMPYGPSGFWTAWKVQILHVVPATERQHPVLNVAVGPPAYGQSDFGWGWQLHDLDGDGVPEIELGPRDGDGAIQARAVYRYSEATDAYEGPAGSMGGDFFRFDLEREANAYPIAEAFALAHHDDRAIEAAARMAGSTVHHPTGLAFPNATRTLHQTMYSVLTSEPPPLGRSEASERDIAVTYHSDDEEPLAITVFVYAKVPPASAPDESLLLHSERVHAEIVKKYSNVTCAPWPELSEAVPGEQFAEACSYQTEMGDSREDLRSYVVLRDLPGFWLKYRATAKVAKGLVVEAALRELLKAMR
jgi:hypothetical protein